MSDTKPRVAIIGGGGTISFTGRHSLDLYDYAEFGRLHPIDAVVAAGAKAIVVAGFSPGVATAAQKEALAGARRQGVHVIMSTRSPPVGSLNMNRLAAGDGSRPTT